MSKALNYISKASLAILLCLSAAGLCDQATSAKAKAKGKAAAKKAPPSFYKGLTEYNNKRFGPAAEAFLQADRSGYCCDNTHYYLALCYHNLNQTQRAIENYTWVYSYSKNPMLKYQAQVGYEQVARYASNRTYTGNGANFTGFSGGGGGGYVGASAASGCSTGGG